MKQNIVPAIRLTLVCMVFFMGIYSLVIFAGSAIGARQGKR